MTSHIHIQHQLGAFTLQASVTLEREIVVISGANGSGKSTLLRCLAGLEAAQGNVTMDGQLWLDSTAKFSLPISQRALGCVWAKADLLPWLSMEKNIALGAPLDSKRIQDLANALHISHVLQRDTAMLSTGEAQRVALARAVYRQPKVLLLDEPFSAQDPHIRQHLRTWLKSVQTSLNIPVLMISHDAEDAQCLAQQHWHMRQGKLWSTLPHETHNFDAKYGIKVKKHE